MLKVLNNFFGRFIKVESFDSGVGDSLDLSDLINSILDNNCLLLLEIDNDLSFVNDYCPLSLILHDIDLFDLFSRSGVLDFILSSL